MKNFFTFVTFTVFSVLVTTSNAKDPTSAELMAILHHRALAPKKVVGSYSVVTRQSQSTVGNTSNEPRLVYVRHSQYKHDVKKPEIFRGKRDWASAHGLSSTPGLELQEATNKQAGACAVSVGNKGDKWISLSSNKVLVNYDTIGTTDAATRNSIRIPYKVKVRGRWQTKYRTVSLHKTPEQLRAPVVDEAKNRKQSGPDYEWFLYVPWNGPRPFLALTKEERRKALKAAVTIGRLAQATFFQKNRMMAKR